MKQEITRLGENSVRKIDVRIIAATNENLAELIKENEFWEDLYYRLAFVPVKLPALRERREDIPLLIEHFLNKLSLKHKIKQPKIEREVFGAFYNHVWLGNVRELENVIERMVVLSDGATFRHSRMFPKISKIFRRLRKISGFLFPPNRLIWKRLNVKLFVKR